LRARHARSGSGWRIGTRRTAPSVSGDLRVLAGRIGIEAVT
jgi:hypothetical protein